MADQEQLHLLNKFYGLTVAQDQRAKCKIGKNTYEIINERNKGTRWLLTLLKCNIRNKMNLMNRIVIDIKQTGSAMYLDIVITKYNLLEYNNNYSERSVSLC